MNILDLVEIRPYEEDYDNLLKDFEKVSATNLSQSFPKSFIKTSTVFYHRFSDKSKLFEWSQIYMVLDKNTHEILGTGQMAMKTITLAGEQEKIMMISGIKIHPDVQSQGVGSKLVTFMHKKAKDMDVSKIVVKLSSGNRKAIRFFLTKLSYQDASYVSMVVINNPKISDEVKSISKDEGQKRTEEFYNGKDLNLKSYKGIFDSPGYLGSFKLEKGTEFIGGSLYNVSYYSEVEITKIILDKKYLLNNTYYYLILIVIFLILLTEFISGYWAYNYYFEDMPYKIMFATSLLLVNLIIIQSFSVLFKFCGDLRKLRKPRLKIFGLFYSNSIESKQEIFYTLINHMAAVVPCEYTSIEFHEDDIYNKFLENADFLKIYMQKNLNNTPVFKWNKRHFVDPRD
ncbi:hypothetical protein SteCoe_20259 [Stentor coeruleus]|uniref:N-acetyltransferase domain-containing protein n=1 Tax=Stentor coeruleus TaxID=5963 RepID=A0A1R2BSL6_9CILI|nr:hypothetical protein SteCoe_20259 [Stentor coeruleus]